MCHFSFFWELKGHTGNPPHGVEKHLRGALWLSRAHMRSSNIIEKLQRQRQREGRKTRYEGATRPVAFSDRSSRINENLQSSCQAIQDARDTSQTEKLKQNQSDDDRRDFPNETYLHADPSCGHSSPSSLGAITWKSAWDVLHTTSYICSLRSDKTHGGTLSRMGGRLQKGPCNDADPSRRNSTHAASTALALLFLVFALLAPHKAAAQGVDCSECDPLANCSAQGCFCPFGAGQPANWSGIQGGKCIECPAGSYKDNAQNEECKPCGAGRYSTVAGASNDSTCENCLAGKYATGEINDGESDCILCKAGKYSGVVAAASENECQPCPSNAISPPGSELKQNCQCTAGYTGHDGDECSACLRGEYKELIGDYACMMCPVAKFNPVNGSSACLSCPGISTSSGGSYDISNCSCAPGFTGPDRSACSACPAGSFKPVTGFRTCELCEKSKYAEAPNSTTCTSCPEGAVGPVGSNNRSNCACNAGFMPDAKVPPNVTICLECQAGKFSQGNLPCQLCPSGSYSDGPRSSKCKLCPVGYYNPSAGSSVCVQCEVGVTVFSGSIFPSDCYDVDRNLYSSAQCGSLNALPAGAPSRNGHSLASLTYRGRTFLFGGFFLEDRNDIWYYDTAGAQWTEVLIAPGELMPKARSEHSMVNINNKFLIFGGRTGSVRFNDLWEFNPELFQWKERVANENTQGPVARFAHSAVSAFDYMLIFGGQDTSDQRLNDFWKWSSSGWTELSPSLLPSPRAGHRMVRSGKNIYLFGGRDASSAVLNDLWEYESESGEWRLKNSVNSPPARRLHAMVAIGPLFFVHAGVTMSSRLNDLWQYDTSQDLWFQVFNSTTSRRFLHQMVVLDGKIMIHGGTADMLVGLEVQQYIANDALIFLPCACLEGTTTLPGSYKCAKCPVSTYKDWNGTGSCLDCPKNSTSPAGSKSQTNCVCQPGFYKDGVSCEACPSGLFSKDAQLPCQACAAGTFSSKASTSCTVCPAGKFSEEDTGYGRAVCESCPEYSISPVGSQLLTNCTCSPGYTGITSCTICRKGTYKANYGSVACSLCPSGKYSSIRGQTNACKICPNQTGSDEGAEECECLAGLYNASVLNASVLGALCLPCEPGTWKSIRGNVECTEVCGHNKTSLPGGSSDDDCICMMGYGRVLTADAGGKVSCTACPPGTFKPQDGNSACISCAKGTYSGVTAATACNECPSNHTTSQDGSTNLQACLCKEGYFFINGSCLPCTPGTFQNASGSDRCIPCSIGFYSTGAARFCISCPSYTSSLQGSGSVLDCLCIPGYTAGTTQACVACPAGSSKGTSGSDPCTWCGIGKYAGPNSTFCTSCPTGSSTLTVSSTSVTDCNACTPGYTGNVGSCSPCQPGSYKNVSGSSQCIQCAPGSYQDASASINCTLCPENKYMYFYEYHYDGSLKGANASTYCTACPADKVSTAGGRELSDCRCNMGFTGPDGDGTCVACSEGAFKAHIGWAACTACQPGTYASNSGMSSCVLCEGGKFLTTPNSTSLAACRTCPDNSDSPAGSALEESCVCNRGFGKTVDGRCEACLPGTFKNETAAKNCSDCPPGSFSGQVASMSCSLCASGTYSTAVGATGLSVCRNCSTFSSSLQGSAKCQCNKGYAGSEANGNCTACAAGFYKDVVANIDCLPCPVGSFSNSFAQTSCSACPLFASTARNQSTQLAECECIPGYIGNSGSCSACQPGTYKPVAGSSNCTQCAVAKYSDVQAGSSESVCTRCQDPFAWSPSGSNTSENCVCNVGYFRPVGAIFCRACQNGKYRPQVGYYSSCIDCPNYTTTLTNATSTEEGCLCLPGHEGGSSDLQVCSPCNPGYYKHVLGTARCRACDFGKYLAAAGAKSELECQSCPLSNQWSPNASAVASACRCAKGYTLTDPTACSACEPGLFKPNPGNMSCTQCYSGTYSSAAAESCTECPQNSNSLAGSGNLTDCLCNMGSTGRNGGPCSLCLPGTFKSSIGSVSCTLCQSGTYLNSSGSVDKSECVQCPQNSNSPPGGVSTVDCVCGPGFTGTSESCEQCPAGKYKSTNGSTVCLNCTAGTYSEAVAATTAASCFSCVSNSFAPSGSVRIEDCACNAGYTLMNAVCSACELGTYKTNIEGSSVCLACQVGKYAEVIGLPECRICPTNSSTTSAGSTSIALCICNAGYLGSLGNCIACPRGTFKTSPGSGACIKCAVGKYSNQSGAKDASACVSCGNGTVAREGSDSQDDCICRAGFAGVGQACNACETGKFKAANGSSPCEMCPSGKYSGAIAAVSAFICQACPSDSNSSKGSISLLNCTCNKGYSGPNGQTCLGCTAGTYKDWQGQGECAMCPQNSISVAAATSISACICKAGYTSLEPNGSPCQACLPGSFKVLSGSIACTLCEAGKYSSADAAISAGTCVSCPPNTVSSSGASLTENCTCNAGYQRSYEGTCELCPVNSYKNTSGENECTKCPAGMTSAAGAIAVSACLCDVGYGGDACQACPAGTYNGVRGASTCLLCPEGKFSTSSGKTSQDVCTLCPPHMLSIEGSSARESCICTQGFVRTNASICEVCPPGSYNARQNSSSCNLCGPGLYSMEGSDTASDCREYSFSVQGRLILNGVQNIQTFLSKQKQFITSLTIAVNQATLISSDFFTVTKVCDITMCYEIVKNSISLFKNLTTEPGVVEVEFDVRTPPRYQTINLVGALGTTLQRFNHQFFEGDTSKYAVYSVLPVAVSSSQMLETCGRWYELSSTGDNLIRHCMAQANGKFFAFGGQTNDGSYTSKLRQFDSLTREWITMVDDSSPASPAARIDAQLVGQNDKLFLFGGRDLSKDLDGRILGGRILNDLWKLNLPTWTWEKISLASNAMWPVLRYSHSMSADEQGGFLMFGGVTGGVTGGETRLNDLWRWDEGSLAWIELRSNGNTDGPSGREGHAVAMIGSELFMFGGRTPSSLDSNELWKYIVKSGIWVKINATGPSARRWHAMAAVNGSLLLFGGESGNTPLSDIWVYQPKGMMWSQLQDNGNLNGPGPRSLFALASVGSKVIFHGGRNFQNTFKHTWEYVVCRCDAGAERIGGLCALCQPGTFKNMPGPESCTLCPVAKFSAIIGSTEDACSDCQANSYSPPGSIMPSNCSCREGYSPEGDACIACIAGKFKATIGAQHCVACGKGTYNSVEAAPRCTLCPEGKYGADLNRSRTHENISCFLCPENSTSLAGAPRQLDCICEKGYSGKNGSNCTACLPGYYKDRYGENACSYCIAGTYSNKPARDTTCIPCGAGTYSSALGATEALTCVNCPSLSYSSSGASSLNQCLCIAGASGTNGNCSACVAGKYKSINDSSLCLDCSPGSYSTSASSTSCQKCTAGKYSNATTVITGVCVDCPGDTTSTDGSGNISDCLCNAGFTGTYEKCDSCSPGTFKESLGRAKCTNCPPSTFSGKLKAKNSTSCVPCPTRSESPPGSANRTQCACVAGSEWKIDDSDPDGGSCELCSAGKYKGSGPGNCADCPSGSWNEEGSKNSTHCKCMQGYFGPDGSACVKCAAGKFKSTNGSSACTDCVANKFSTEDGARTEAVCIPCPQNSTSPAGSNSTSSCLCIAGYQGNGVSACTACAAGKYKHMSGQSNCSECPPNSISPTGSTSILACICTKGYSGLATCSACAAGTYKEFDGSMPCTLCDRGKYAVSSAADASAACVSCPNFTNSVSGSSSILDCTCNQGYFGANGAACSACGSGKYKPTNGTGNCTLCSEGKFGTELGAVAESSCQTCPQNSYSVAGSSASTECFCTPGYSEAKLTAVCLKCPAGTYKSEFGRSNCTRCPKNTYGDQEGADSVLMCKICPANTNGQPGSNALTDCSCIPGYFLVGTCSQCPRGTYKVGSGNQACTLCPSGTFSGARGATSESTCTPCPQYSSSLSGAAGSWECLCKPGYTGFLADCIACTPGTYKDTFGDEPCTLCGPGKYSSLSQQESEQLCISCPDGTTTSQAGNTGVAACTCKIGFTGGGGSQACLPCKPGTYKDSLGSANCTWCALGKYSGLEAQGAESSCRTCPIYSSTLQPGSLYIAQCFCQPGYTGDLSKGMQCTNCPNGTSKGEFGTGECLLCSPGSYQNRTGQERCNLCPAGTYFTRNGSRSIVDCIFCPPRTFSIPGSVNITACLCNAGYTGPNSGPCVACTPGTFKAQRGSAPCDQCQQGSWDNRNASTSCFLCAPGKYSSVRGAIQSTTCIDCPQQSFSYNGSKSILDCLCIPGFTGQILSALSKCTPCTPGFDKTTLGNMTCSPCTLGTYSTNSGTSSCIRCPDRSSTPNISSTNLSQCLCMPGYAAGTPQNCTACVPGTYKMVLGSSGCVQCGQGKYSVAIAATNEAACVTCPDLQQWSRNGSNTVLDCVCERGYTFISKSINNSCEKCASGKFKPTPGNQKCEDCRAGTYSDATGAITNDTCLICPSNSYSLKASSQDTDCKCNRGYSGSDGGPCPACPVGKIKNTDGDGDCQNCSVGAFANLSGSSVCTLCAEGKYSTEVGAQSAENCQNCPNFQTSIAGSDDRTDCGCISGYTGYNGVGCTACPAGSSKNSTGDATCENCTRGFYNPSKGAAVCLRCLFSFSTQISGSDNDSDCLCDAGFGLPKDSDGLACEMCAMGYYKNFVDDVKCFACTNNSNSLIGSSSVKSCTCNMGYTGPDGGSCEPCANGTFKSMSGSSPCILCPAGKFLNESGAYDVSQCVECPMNSNSLPGGASLGDCVCNAGFTGQNGACSNCVPGKYKPISGSATCTDCLSGQWSAAIAADRNTTCKTCPNNSWSESGASAFEECKCNAGYTGPVGRCTSCSTGTYKSTRGSENCTMCGVGKYLGVVGATAESQCLMCPNRTTSKEGSVRPPDCVCASGFTGPGTTGSPQNYTTNCTACSLGSFKSVVGSSACVACGMGKYANVTGLTECFKCNNNSFSNVSSLSVEQCICNAGYTGAAGVCTGCEKGTNKSNPGPANCSLCPADTYQEEIGQLTCTRCPRNTSSQPGSGSRFNCLCNPGYSGNDTICSPCEVGKFKAIHGDARCVECAAGKYADRIALIECRTCHNGSSSSVGSTRSADCICMVGYTERRITSCSNSTQRSSCVDFVSCPACVPGTYKSVNGSIPCSLCVAGKYLETFAATNITQCLNCSRNASSLSGAEFCSCNAGFTGTRGNCSKCVPGTFKGFNGSAPCTLCPAAKYSNVEAAKSNSTCQSCPVYMTSSEGSARFSDCKCNLGWYGNTDTSTWVTIPFNWVSSALCTTCISGTYKDQVGSAACSSCPNLFTSEGGSKSKLDCYCQAGTYQNDTNSGGNTNCISCPQGHWSKAKSTSVSNCQCNSGYTGTGGGPGNCVACARGKYKSGEGSASCIECPIGNYYTETGGKSCTNCPLYSTTSGLGKINILDCECQVGAFGPNGRACSKCPADTYKDAMGSQNCSICPFPSKSPQGSDQLDDCKCVRGGACFPCPHGTYRNWVGEVTSCVPCEAGKYSSTVGATSSSTCLDCPKGLTTKEVGMYDILNCTCNAGFERVFVPETGGLRCRGCRIGFYKTNAFDACTECPSNSTTESAGATDVETCVCSRGFTEQDNVCISCEKGKYKSILGNMACRPSSSGKYVATSGSTADGVSCPAFTTSMPGSSNILNCSCLPGFKGPDGGPCLACPNNTYKEVLGPSECQTCPFQSLSNASSTRRVDCQCNLGYYGKNGTSCTSCEVGTYKGTLGEDQCTPCPNGTYSPGRGQISVSVCTQCPANATSLKGSSELTDCTCNPGFWGKNGTSCNACDQAYYKEAVGESPSGLITDCKQCPANSWAPFASPYCRCDMGYEGPPQDDSRSSDCALCPAGKYKTARGSEPCEECHERIKPMGFANWESPTNPTKSCDWRCNSGYYYPDSDYLKTDLQSFTQLRGQDPAWFTWYELEEYKVKTPSKYYSDTRRFLPHTCKPCTRIPPAQNPCGYGEYWSRDICNSGTNRDNGCKPCENDIGRLEGGAYVWPNPMWQMRICPYTCKVGYYISDKGVLRGQVASFTAGFYDVELKGQNLDAVCVKCPNPSPSFPATEGACETKQPLEIYMQCGFGMGAFGFEPPQDKYSVTRVINWNGTCYKPSGA